MSQFVPSWDLENNPGLATTARHSFRSKSKSNSTAPAVPMVDYEVAELTWENGQIAMHGLGPPRVAVKPISSLSTSKYTWDKQPRGSGTLESIVNQATGLPCRKTAPLDCAVNNDELVPWFDHHGPTASSTSSATATMDALVPGSNRSKDRTAHLLESVPVLGGATCAVGCSTRVASCSGPSGATHEKNKNNVLKRAREARVPVAGDRSSKDQSVSASATFGSQQMHPDTYDKDLGRGFTSTYSLGSPENTTSRKSGTKTTIPDDHDSVCHGKPQREVDEKDKKKESGKCSVSTTRSRAAAIHNQSERKRRDKINQRMKTLQKLVPNSSKTDKASMLDEVIDYLKQLQEQVQMMSRMNMPMMLPISMQQQLQMSMMAPMSMGMGMGMGMGVMDMNTLGRANTAGMSPVMANPFMPMTSWESSAGDRGLQGQPSPVSVMPDPMSAFLACHSQPMTLDAYSKMAAMYQQMQQPPASNSKS